MTDKPIKNEDLHPMLGDADPMLRKMIPGLGNHVPPSEFVRAIIDSQRHQPPQEDSVADNLTILNRRLNHPNGKHIRQLGTKKATLIELARIIGKGPLSAMLLEISDDLGC